MRCCTACCIAFCSAQVPRMHCNCACCCCCVRPVPLHPGSRGGRHCGKCRRGRHLRQARWGDTVSRSSRCREQQQQQVQGAAATSIVRVYSNAADSSSNTAPSRCEEACIASRGSASRMCALQSTLQHMILHTAPLLPRCVSWPASSATHCLHITHN